MEFGEKIKQKRKALRLSAEDLALKLGLKKANIYKWENGSKPSDPEEFIVIKNWLSEKKEYADLLRQAVNYALATGFNPFIEPEPTLEVAVRNWTFVQCLNFFKQKLQNRGLRKRSIQSYESVLRMLYVHAKEFLQVNVKQITRQQITLVLQSAFDKNKWTNTTYNGNLTFVKAIFNWLIDAGLTEENPARKIKHLPSSIKKHRYYDDATFERIKKNATPELLDFILFLYHTGTRPNEARQLRYEHIDRDNKLLFIPSTISKNKKDDYVPLTEYVLTKYVNKEGLIFGGSVNHYGQLFAKLKKKLGLQKDFTLYSVKHTRAVHLAQDGASPYAIMQLFRHSGLDITMTYLKDLGLTVNREAAEKVRQ